MARVLLLGLLFSLRLLPASAQAPLSAEVIAAHNQFRSAAHVPPITWDDGLALDAQEWAQRLAQLSRLEHSPRWLRRGEGENLWMGTAGAFTAAEMVAGWGEEGRDYRDGVYPDVSRTGHPASVSHYTQVMWRGTTRVGCGLARSGSWDILVCRYSAPGNVAGQTPY